MDLDENAALEAVLASFADTPDDRTRQILEAITRHLHALVRELRPSQREWEQAIAYLTEVGHRSDGTRQEFVMLSDVLGVSTVVETMNSDPLSTPGTVLGPFHQTESPRRELGDSLVGDSSGVACAVSGTVTDEDGKPLAAASVDVWQCNEHGFYDVQEPAVQAAGNGRGAFTTDANGQFWFNTVVPSHYPIPTDGPVGRLLAASRRHPYRPAHIHFIAASPGHQTVTTHAFVAESPYLDSDAVFAVKSALIIGLAECSDPAEAARLRLPSPFRRAQFDIRLARRER